MASILNYHCYHFCLSGTMENTEILIHELKKLLNGGTAHAGLKDALNDIPFDFLGKRPHGLP